MKHPEYLLQCSVCAYLKLQFPTVLFLSDTIANIRLTIGQSMRNKKIQKEDFKTPDLLILQPNKNYHGLFIELKVKSPYKKDGTLLKDEHLEGQLKTIKALRRLGYMADFAVGFDQARAMIDAYMKDV